MVEGGLLALVVCVSRCPEPVRAGVAAGAAASFEGVGDPRPRHELAILHRKSSRPTLTRADRALPASLSGSMPRPAWTVFSFQPETLLAWLRQLIASRVMQFGDEQPFRFLIHDPDTKSATPSTRSSAA